VPVAPMAALTRGGVLMLMRTVSIDNSSH